MRFFFVLFFSIGLLLNLNAQNYLIKAYYNPEKLSIAWSAYELEPNDNTAIEVYNLLPKEGHVRKEDSDLSLEDNIYSNLGIIENQIHQGKRNSVKLAFRLFTISDGAFSETLDIILGSITNTYPELFLQELNNHIHLVNLPGLLGNLGPDFVDEFDKQKIEIELRIEKLNQVENKKLKKTQDLCITELQKHLAVINSFIDTHGSTR